MLCLSRDPLPPHGGPFRMVAKGLAGPRVYQPGVPGRAGGGGLWAAKIE